MSITISCPNCGFENQSTSKFCPNCGKPLPEIDEVTETMRKMLETEVLKVIKDLAEKGQTPMEYIQSMAEDTLELLPVGSTKEYLLLGAVMLQNKYPELKNIVVSALKDAE